MLERCITAIEPFFKWLIFTNLYIAIAAVCFFLTPYLLFEWRLNNIWLIPYIFSSTLFVYQLSRWNFFKREIDHNEIKDNIYYWIRDKQLKTKFSIVVSFILTIVSFFFLGREMQVISILLGVISVAYSIPLPFSKERKKLRDYPYVKIFLIALVWTYLGAVFPFLDVYGEWNFDLMKWAYLQFIFIVFITLPFDMKDVKVDVLTSVKTIPSKIGFEKTKRIVLSLGVFYIVGLSFLLKEIAWYNFLAVCSIIIFLMACTYNMEENIKKWHVMLIYDGSMILIFLLLALLR